ncbi:MAG: leucine-rich repeat protein [Prevotella sp.]|nr:leucine-rich repeat protein [Prevotella sp.]
MIPPHIEQNTFSNVKNISLYVPPGKIAAYKAADIWKGFKVIDELQYIFKSVTQQGIKMQFRVVDDEEKAVETYAGDYNSAEDFVPCINSETKGDLIIPAEIDGYRVVGIGSNSFRECIGITSVSIPAGISYIGEGAFRLATNLRAVNIPEGVEEIMAYSFNGCPLTMVVLPSTLKRITGTYAFRYGNIKNESATCNFIANMKRPCTLDENSIFGMEYYDLYVPKNRIEFYLDEPQWDKFRSIHEMGEVDEDATDRVTVSSVTLKAGENATLTVSLNTTGGTNYKGYQFNLYLPEGISVSTDENGNYLVTEKTGRKKVVLPVEDGSVLFYTMADKNHAALASGPLMEIKLTADSALAAGKYTVRIERITCATRDNESVGLPSSTATITVEKAGTDTQGVITADDVEGEPASRITLPVFLNNAKDINAFYFDLTLPKGVTVATEKNGQFIATFTGDYGDTMLLSCLPWDASMGTTNNVNTWRFIATPKDNGVFHANAGRVMNVTLEVDKDMAGGVYTARMNVVKFVEANDAAAGSRTFMDNPFNPLSTDNSFNSSNSLFGVMHAPASSAAWTSYSTITIKTQKQGDVNGDNTIDVADIATVIDVMAGSADVSSASADVNGDGTVDVADIAAIIDTMAANARRQRDIIQIGFR